MRTDNKFDAAKFNYDTLIEVLDATPCLHELRITDLETNVPSQMFRSLAKMIVDTEVSSQPQFLSMLHSFSYCCSSMNLWDCASSWEILPPLIDKLHSRSCDRIDHRHFPTLELNSYTPNGGRFNLPKCDNKNALIRILKLARSGVSIYLMHDWIDMLESSMKHLGITEY